MPRDEVATPAWAKLKLRRCLVPTKFTVAELPQSIRGARGALYLRHARRRHRFIGWTRKLCSNGATRDATQFRRGCFSHWALEDFILHEHLVKLAHAIIT